MAPALCQRPRSLTGSIRSVVSGARALLGTKGISLLGAKTLLGAPGLTTRNKKLLRTKGVRKTSQSVSKHPCLAGRNWKNLSSWLVVEEQMLRTSLQRHLWPCLCSGSDLHILFRIHFLKTKRMHRKKKQPMETSRKRKSLTTTHLENCELWQNTPSLWETRPQSVAIHVACSFELHEEQPT